MQPNTYRFLINSVEVFPHYKSLQKKYSVENGQKFFRVTLEGEIKLYGADYFLIKNSPVFSEFTFIIQQKVEGSWENYYEGTFSKTDCEINIDKREVKIKVSAKDQYSDIMNNYSNEYNLTDLAPALTPVLVTKRPILQIYTYEDNIINNFLPSGETWEQEVSLGDMSITDLYEQHFSSLLGSILTEVRISAGGPYDGIYTTNIQQGLGLVFMAPNNLAYSIVGNVTPSNEDVTYGFTLYSATDTTLSNPLYQTGLVVANSKYTTLKFINTKNENDYFMADVATHFIFMRLLSGFSVMHSGEVADGKLEPGSFGYINGYSYAYSVLGCASLYLAAANSVEPTSYGKAENGLYYSPPKHSGVHFYPFSKSTWDYTSKWATLTAKFMQYDTQASVYAEIKDCIHIADAIACLLKKIEPSLTHEATEEYSAFLYGQTNPVYGQKLDLFITQKSNILKFIYDEPAKKVPITFESLMNMLKKCFNCYWFIEDNKFRIEHSSYFKNGRSYIESTGQIGLDLTKLYDNKNGRPLGYGQNIISFDKDKLPSRYEFSYMDDVSIEFEGPAIKLSAPYLQQDKIESIAVESFNADIDMMLSNPEGTSKDGFALLAAKYTKNEVDNIEYYSTFLYSLDLYDEEGNTYSVKLQNGVLSWLYLANFYFTEMPTTVAEYDGYPKVPIRITGISSCMSQEVSIPVKNDPDLYTLVATDIGNGQISSMSIDITTRHAKISLIYEPE